MDWTTLAGRHVTGKPRTVSWGTGSPGGGDWVTEEQQTLTGRLGHAGWGTRKPMNMTWMPDLQRRVPQRPRSLNCVTCQTGGAAGTHGSLE